MSFTTNKEVLICICSFPTGNFALESELGKVYDTALHALANIEYDNLFSAHVLNPYTGQCRDVTSDLAKAYIAKFDPQRDDVETPEFVRIEKGWA